VRLRGSIKGLMRIEPLEGFDSQGCDFKLHPLESQRGVIKGFNAIGSLVSYGMLLMFTLTTLMLTREHFANLEEQQIICGENGKSFLSPLPRAII